ncbi:DUF4012 domain-containing protein [Pseudarthrobacter sp. NS4]|uniref:DUF4012 domain-containing protein n=1 Tax=Pseudarthrobacter sp. NS4 TaxID=2973976 RepID=UPI00216149FD|nr:DUF4012 domain-containing protein [Pseudarthrobacter sp. NS4]
MRKHRWSVKARLFVFAGILLAAGGAGSIWLTYNGMLLRSELLTASSLIPSFRTQVLQKDFVSAEATLNDIREHVKVAESAATDPLWKVATGLPWLGPNLSAATEIALSADDVVVGAAAPLLRVADSLDWDALTPRNGKIDVRPLAGAAPDVASAAHTVQLTHARLSSIDDGQLHAEVAGPLRQMTDIMADLGRGLKDAANASALLPPMLGTTTDPRNYLVLMQNSAEVRATGGLPGALAVIRVEDGALELTAQVSGAALGRFVPPVEVDASQSDIYSSRLGAYISDVNLTPDFPTAALTAKSMWEDRYGTVIDGVIALDPVVLAYFLAASGPVSVPQVVALPGQEGLPSTLTADNVVPTLLSDVYRLVDKNEHQDAYFASVSRAVFDGISSGSISSHALVDAVVKSTAENRLRVWSARKNEQEILQETTLGGSISGPAAGSASFGVYFNDGTGAKMDYYVRRTVQLEQACPVDGYSQYRVKITLTNTAPSDAATVLPTAVTGGGGFGTAPGSVQTNVMAYGPTLSHVDSVSQDGTRVSFGSHIHSGRPLGMVAVKLGPGDSTTVEMVFVKVVQEGAPSLSVTPTVEPVKDVTLPTKIAQCAA